MFRFNRLLCGLVVCGTVAVAFGAAVKIKAFTPVGNGAIESPDGDGMAILNYHPGNDTTEIQFAITDFRPNTVYGVKLESDFGGFSAPEAIATNVVGNGTYHHTIPFDRTGNPSVTIYVWDGDTNTIFDVSADEIRATGN